MDERIALLSNGVTGLQRYHDAALDSDRDLRAATPQTLNGYYGTWSTRANTVIGRRQLALPDEVMTRDLLGLLTVSDIAGRKPLDPAAVIYDIRNSTTKFIINGAVVWSTEFIPLEDERDLSTILRRE
jgi:hypothetical protein